VNYLNYTMMHGLTNLKFTNNNNICLPVCNPSIFQQELHTNFRHDAADCRLGNFEGLLQANVRITTCQETQRQCQSFLNRNGFPERSVLFRDCFFLSNWVEIQIHWETFWWNSYITRWPTENSRLPANSNRWTLPCLCAVACHHRHSFLFSFRTQCI